LLRMRLLMGAAHSYLASGGILDQLSPGAAAKMGLLPEAIAGDEPRSQVYGYWPLSALRRTQTFQRIISWIVRKAPLRYRLAQELGPAPKFAGSTSGIWLGPWEDGAVAVGVVGTPQGLRNVLSNYGSKAEKVYFPYPLVYTGRQNKQPEALQLLLMVFRPETIDSFLSHLTRDGSNIGSVLRTWYRLWGGRFCRSPLFFHCAAITSRRILALAIHLRAWIPAIRR
jgi:hypothetical protein